MSRLLFLGDVYLPTPVAAALPAADGLVYNLEYVLTATSHGWPRKVNLKAERDHAPASFGSGPRIACLANNHIMDFGAEGLADTLRALREAGVPFFGAGDLRDDCHNPAVVEVGGRRVAFLGYVCPTANPVFATESRPGVLPIDRARIAADVAAVRAAGADRVVVSLHWGVEEIELPRPTDILLGRSIAEIEGVNLIVGHHAHCVHPWEIHRGVPIFYGLGNAVFPDVVVPAEYDDHGQPTVMWKKRQKEWNRRSIGVTWDVETGAVEPTLLRFDGRALGPAGGGAVAEPLDYRSAEEYAARFKRAFTWGTVRAKLLRYLSDPKMPEPRHLRSLARIAREAVWREGR